MKASSLSRVVFGSMLVAVTWLLLTVLSWQEPGQPTTLEPVSSAQETKGKAKKPAAVQLVGSVDDKALLNAAGNTANWLMYGRTYDANRFSPLEQINKTNVKRLIPVWTFQTGVLDGFE